jgi:hypothetical protein
MPAERRAWNFPVTLVARLDPGYAFAQWEDSISGETFDTPEITFWMPAATLTMTATAIPLPEYAVTVTAGAGVAYAEVTGGAMHRAETFVRLSASVLPGYEFAGWFAGDELVVGPEAWGFVMPHGHVSLEARAMPAPPDDTDKTNDNENDKEDEE